MKAWVFQILYDIRLGKKEIRFLEYSMQKERIFGMAGITFLVINLKDNSQINYNIRTQIWTNDQSLGHLLKNIL